MVKEFNPGHIYSGQVFCMKCYLCGEQWGNFQSSHYAFLLNPVLNPMIKWLCTVVEELATKEHARTLTY